VRSVASGFAVVGVLETDVRLVDESSIRFVGRASAHFYDDLVNFAALRPLV
jgi:hypothetical protein